MVKKTVKEGLATVRRRNPKHIRRTKRIDYVVDERELKTLEDRARYWHMPLATYARAAALNYRQRDMKR